MSTNIQQTPIDKALAKIANVLITRMEELKGENWQQPWLSTSYQGLPQNITGRTYNGMNKFMLDLVTSVNGHEMPVFLTFNQASKEGIHINKGAVSMPVLYYERSYKDQAGNRLTEAQAAKLTEEQRKELIPHMILKKFDVFNIADTNFKEVKPELYAKLQKDFAISEIKTDVTGMYANKELDRMLSKQEWLCPIDVKKSDAAYYSPSTDSITLPLKSQFRKGETADEIYRSGMEFYSTALHEITHSTGASNRLDRLKEGSKFGDKTYAKEELVAELTAASISHTLGFERQITDNSAKYLSNWVGALKEEPKFILSVLSDVSKASSLIMGEIEKQQVAIKQADKEQTQKARSLYDLEAQYDNINARYPAAVNDAATRQIKHRIDQANQIIIDYEENIKKYYGTDWFSDPKNAHTPIPKDVYTGKLSQSEHIVGSIHFHDEDSTMYFSDKNKYLTTIKSELDVRPGAFTFKTLTNDPATRKAVDDLIYNFDGFENPKSLQDYTKKGENVTDASLVKLRNGEFAVRGKIEGKETSLLSISKEEAVSYMVTPTHQKEELLNILVLTAVSNSDLATPTRSLSPKR